MKAFGLELSSLRKAARLSQEELAHRAKVNRTYVAKLELGENQPTLTSMQNLAGALGKPLPEMIENALERYDAFEELPVISASGNLVKSVFEKENGLEEAVFRRADHRLFATGRGRRSDQGTVPTARLQ